MSVKGIIGTALATASLQRNSSRWKGDGGVLYDASYLYLKRLMDDNAKYGSNLKLCINALAATKIRTSGVNSFATKSYDIAPHSPQLGPELIVNGGFDSDSNWGKQDVSITITGGKLNFTNTPTLKGCVQSPFIVGKLYMVTYTVESVSLGAVNLYYGINTANIATPGTYSYIVLPTVATLSIGSVGVTTAVVDNVSVREVLINDATQTTATNQPYLSNIAPIEKPALLNPNGDDCFMTHPTISFGASDPWSVEVVLNWNGESSATDSNIIYGSNTSSFLSLRRSSINSIHYGDQDGNRINCNIPTSALINKTVILTFSHNGTNLNIYVNGILARTLSSIYTSKFVFNGILTAVVNYKYYGKLYHYSIFSKSLSDSEVANRTALLRSIYPEIESVPIGTQTWAVRNYDAVCTPQGNLIPEVQSPNNVIKLVGSDFVVGGGWSKIGDILYANSATSAFDAYRALTGGVLTKIYKLTFTISNYVGGSVSFRCGGASAPTVRSGNGTFVEYLPLLGNNTFSFLAVTTFTATISNISVQEVGWSDSQNLYDYIYANTAGTTEQKTYAAVKAAGFWCHYNNDPANGAIYSKLYNWFAVKLLQMDIDYYNAANPTTPWGWRVSSDAEFPTDADSLKHLGNDFWTVPNTGTNTTGFTSLPGGYRDDLGSFYGINTHAVYNTQTKPPLTSIGASVRLIKSQN